MANCPWRNEKVSGADGNGRSRNEISVVQIGISGSGMTQSLRRILRQDWSNCGKSTEEITELTFALKTTSSCEQVIKFYDTPGFFKSGENDARDIHIAKTLCAIFQEKACYPDILVITARMDDPELGTDRFNTKLSKLLQHIQEHLISVINLTRPNVMVLLTHYCTTSPSVRLRLPALKAKLEKLVQLNLGIRSMVEVAENRWISNEAQLLDKYGVSLRGCFIQYPKNVFAAIQDIIDKDHRPNLDLLENAVYENILQSPSVRYYLAGRALNSRKSVAIQEKKDIRQDSGNFSEEEENFQDAEINSKIPEVVPEYSEAGETLKELKHQNESLHSLLQEMLLYSEGRSDDAIKIAEMAGTITSLRNQVQALEEKCQDYQGQIESLESTYASEKLAMKLEYEDSRGNPPKDDLTALARKCEDYESRLAIFEDEKMALMADYEEKIRTMEGLLDQVLTAQVDEIQKLRMEYENYCKENNKDCLEGDGVSVDDSSAVVRDTTVAQNLFQKFQGLPSEAQGLILAAVGISSLVIGYYSYNFINWVWPKMYAFAVDPRVLLVASVAGALMRFVQSPAFQEIKRAWELGEPLSPILFRRYPQLVKMFTSLASEFLRARRVGII